MKNLIKLLILLTCTLHNESMKKDKSINEIQMFQKTTEDLIKQLFTSQGVNEELQEKNEELQEKINILQNTKTFQNEKYKELDEKNKKLKK